MKILDLRSQVTSCFIFQVSGLRFQVSDLRSQVSAEDARVRPVRCRPNQVHSTSANGRLIRLRPIFGGPNILNDFGQFEPLTLKTTRPKPKDLNPKP